MIVCKNWHMKKITELLQLDIYNLLNNCNFFIYVVNFYRKKTKNNYWKFNNRSWWEQNKKKTIRLLFETIKIQNCSEN